MRKVLSTGSTVTGEPIHYPAVVPRIDHGGDDPRPGTTAGWHTHPVPLFAYILEGELARSITGREACGFYRRGDGLVEAMDQEPQWWLQHGRSR